MVNNKKLAKKDSLDEKCYTNALLESMDSKIDAVLEDRKTLNEKIDRHYEEFKEFRSEMNYKIEVFAGEIKNKANQNDLILLDKKVGALGR